MARFLFASWPYSGCLYPQLAAADALRARGHEAAFYTGGRAADLIRSQGHLHFPFQKALSECVDRLLLSPDGISAHWPNMVRRLPALRQFLCDTMPWQMEDLTPIVREWGPQVVICEPAMYAPFVILRETENVPVAMLEYSFCGLSGPDAPPIGFGYPPPDNWLRRLQCEAGEMALKIFGIGFRNACSAYRKRYGLPPLAGSLGDLIAALPLILVPSCPEFDYRRRDLPGSVHYVGACLWYPDREPSPWLADLPADRPLVHVTEGTLYPRSPALLQAAAKGLGGLPLNVVIATGWQRSQESMGLGRTAPNVLVKPWVAYRELLPRTDVVVTIGGGGTVLSALSYGIPIVVTPMMWDHPDNAQRVVEAGAGIRIAPEKATPERVRNAVMRVIEDPSYRESARRMQAYLKQYPGPAGAADLLEQAAAGAVVRTSYL